MNVDSCTKPQHFRCVSPRPDIASLRRSVRSEPRTVPVKVTIGGVAGKVSGVANVRGAMLEKFVSDGYLVLQSGYDGLTVDNPDRRR